MLTEKEWIGENMQEELKYKYNCKVTAFFIREHLTLKWDTSKRKGIVKL